VPIVLREIPEKITKITGTQLSAKPESAKSELKVVVSCRLIPENKQEGLHRSET